MASEPEVTTRKVRVNRISLRAIDKLRDFYRSRIDNYFADRQSEFTDDFDKQIELWITDLTYDQLQSNMTVSNGHKEISINLVKEKYADDICGSNKGIVCPLLDEKEASIKSIQTDRKKAQKSLDTWYYKYLEPVDYETFLIADFVPDDYGSPDKYHKYNDL